MSSTPELAQPTALSAHASRREAATAAKDAAAARTPKNAKQAMEAFKNAVFAKRSDTRHSAILDAATVLMTFFPDGKDDGTKGKPGYLAKARALAAQNRLSEVIISILSPKSN